MLHLFVYLVFFVIVFTNFGLPVHLVSRTSACMNPCATAAAYQIL